MKVIRRMWTATKEAAARLFRRDVQQPVIVIREVLYMWRPSLTIRRTRIDPAIAVQHGQLELF